MEIITPDVVAQVRQKADITDVIGEKVVLRKQGKNFIGLCPFHQDRKPSFNVSPSKQIYKCFACGAGGDVISFVMQEQHITFKEAVQHLAQRYHIPLPVSSPEKQRSYQQQQSKQNQLLEILALAADFYRHALHSSLGEPARHYLSQRQLTPATLQQFQIGFAPPGWQPLYEYLVNQKGIPAQLVADAGLLVARQSGGWYDRFRHRVMLPIFNLKGQVIGFAGRALGDEQPKYLNSPETDLFNKSQVLYALNFARDSIARQDQAIVVEGYFDAIALHQAGITNVVASMGTALTAEQVTALLRYSESKRLILNFDADRAGIQAAERAIAPIADQARRGEVELRLLTIPRGKDADEFLRDHGSEEFRALVEQAPLWLDWQIEQILAAKDLGQANQFQQALQSLTRLLSGLGGHWRTLYIHRVAERLSRGNSRLARDLEEELRKSIRQQRWSRPTSRSHPEKGSKLIQSEFHLLQIFLHFGEYRSLIREELLNRDLQFSYTPHRQLWQGISELVQQQPHLEADTEALLVTLRTFFAQDEALNQRLTHLLWLDETSRIALMRPRMVVRAAIATMELEIRQKRYRYWTQLWDQAYQHRQTEQALYFQEKIQSEYRRIQALQKECQMSAEDLQTSLFNVDEL